MMPDHHQAQLNETMKKIAPAPSNTDIKHAGGLMQSALAVNAAVTNLLHTDDTITKSPADVSPAPHFANLNKQESEPKKEGTIKHVEFFGEDSKEESNPQARKASMKR
jgi:hypothetical protein